MNLYLLTQEDASGYDTYDSCVVAAKNEEDAKQIVPRNCWGILKVIVPMLGIISRPRYC